METRLKALGRALGALGALAALVFASSLPAAACESDLPKIGYLGIGDLECDCTTNVTFHSRDGKPAVSRVWTFRSEPVLGSIVQGGPSWGRLREGDVLTAVDGALITTREGSARFSSLRPGQSVKLTVRREGREIPATVTVGGICPEELSGVFSPGELLAPRAPETPPTPRPGAVPRAPRAPQVGRVPETPAPGATPPTPPTEADPEHPFHWMGRAFHGSRGDFDAPVFSREALPQGWLGIGLRCQECGGERREGEPEPVWRFGSLPTISYVDPEGPSARAGLRRGDQLTHIDGVSLVSEEGGRRFGAVKPGQVVRWRLVREGKPMAIAVTAVQRPGEEGPALGELREQLRALKDAGSELAREREMQEMMRQLGVLDRQREVRRAVERRLRYAGSVAGSDVEVRGLGNVVVDDSGEEIVIITRDATIRIRPGEKARKVEREKNK